MHNILALTQKLARLFDTVRADDASTFREEDHPRAEDGKFGSGGAGASTTESKTPDKKPSKEESFAKSISGKSESDQSHFKAAKQDGVSIPPAWTNVSYFGKAGENGIMAKGTDAKGRSQRLEPDGYREKKIAEKQARIEKNLSTKMPEIQDKLKNLAAEGNENAKVLYLITKTGFRIGGEGDGAARVKAYGASTLMGEHVKVEGDKTTFDFIGKEGVRQLHVVDDPVIASCYDWFIS